MIRSIPYHINKPGEGWKGLNRMIKNNLTKDEHISNLIAMIRDYRNEHTKHLKEEMQQDVVCECGTCQEADMFVGMAEWEIGK